MVDVCRFTPTAGSTANFTFSAAVTGYQSPSLAGIVNGATYHYRAESSDLTQWEIGQGTYNTGTGVLARTTVLYNSAGTGTGSGQSGAGSGTNFTVAPQVAVVFLAEDAINPSPITNSLTSNVLISTSVYTDGPSIAQGSTGTWFASGSVCLNDTAASVAIAMKLWDGTNVIATGFATTIGINITTSTALSGYITNPSGNIRISCKSGSTSASILATVGSSNAAIVSAFRIG